MAKITGLGMSITVDDETPAAQVISNSVSDFQFATPRAVQETTGVDKSAIERLLLLADFSITFNGVFDPTASKAHDVFKTVPASVNSRTTALATAGTVKTMTAECWYTDYQIKRDNNGALTWSAPGVLANGTAPAWT